MGCLLAIDDDRTSLMLLEDQLTRMEHKVIIATSGEEAVALLAAHGNSIDAMLLDRRMPKMDGFAVLKRMQQDSVWRQIPVIMLTGADSAQEMREGLDAGVFYYLVKPVEEPVLEAVVDAALRENQQWRALQFALRQQWRACGLVDSARLFYRTVDEAHAMAAYLAHFFPQPERVLTGLAELLINAVEHGHLGVGYESKSALLAEGAWEEEVARRQSLPENQGKFVEVVFQRKEDGLYVQIADQGIGFDWEPFLTIDPGRATHNHGRGIAQANAQSFDRLQYNAKGNQVLAMVRATLEPAMEW